MLMFYLVLAGLKLGVWKRDFLLRYTGYVLKLMIQIAIIHYISSHRVPSHTIFQNMIYIYIKIKFYLKYYIKN